MANSNFRPIRLLTNSFKITELPQIRYNQYSDFRPPLELKLRQKRIKLMFRLMDMTYPHLFKKHHFIYDGQAIAYAADDPNIPSGTFYVSLAVEAPGDSTLVGKQGYYEIRLTLTAGEKIYPNQIIQHYQSKDVVKSTVATNLLQMIVRQGPNRKNANNGRAYFPEKEIKAIPRSGLGLVRGIFQSVRPTIGAMILTIDTCTAAIHRPGRFYDVALDILGLRNPRDLRLERNSPDFKKLEVFFKKLRIEVNVKGSKTKTKTIYGLEPRAGEYRFTKDDTDTTVKQHYLEAYGVNIEYPLAIGVISSPKSAPFKVVLPGELCEILPGQLFKKKLPDTFTGEMVKFAALKPFDRLDRIKRAAETYDNSPFVYQSGMKLNKNPMLIQAKQLNVPTVSFRESSNVRDGAWNVLRQKLFAPAKLQFWIVMTFSDMFSNTESLNSLIRSRDGLIDCCSKLGMEVHDPLGPYQGNLHDVIGSLNHALTNAGGRNDVLEQLIIVVIVPNNAAHVRHAIKHWGDCIQGVSTQCLRDIKVQSANSQYWNNIALKLNARLKGINFHSFSPAFLELKRAPYIIMGADVGHPGPGVQKPSVASLVYSHDMLGVQYAALTSIQPPRTEKIQDLKKFMMTALNNFGNKNKASPVRLFFYRDGLSEGEYEGVANEEIQDIEDAIKELWSERGLSVKTYPLITYIVVGKRHHAVLFPESQSTGDRKGNAFAGSLVDSEITHPTIIDFYLQSHAAIQGTSRSSHYIVLRDDNFRSYTEPARGGLAMIQDLSFTLCHIYAKATRSVSIPAPVYYADLVCQRGAFHIVPGANVGLDDNASVASGSTNQPFELSMWQSHFLPVHERLAKSMYFL